MALNVKRVDTWAAAIEDGPGSLAAKLNALTNAGVNLEFVIARRVQDMPGTCVVFVTPITGAAKCRVAKQAGFQKTQSLHTVRIEGPDKKGEAGRVAQALADKGLNLHGMSGAAINKKFVIHISLDSPADAAKAVRVVKSM